MIDSPPPAYEAPAFSIQNKDGFFHVEVKASERDLEKLRLSMICEAKKSSLMGMAYVNHLAKDPENSLARDAALLCSGYRKNFADRDSNALLDVCNSIIDADGSDILAIEMAQYMKDQLLGIKSPKTEGRTFIKSLIPSLHKTLTLQPPEKIYAEQKVQIDDMTEAHYAFPDMIKYRGVYYICFREAKSHAGYGDFGKVRILSGNYCPQDNSWEWKHVAKLQSDVYDFRDPKFFVGPNDQLHLIFDGSVFNKKNQTINLVPHIAKQEGNDWNVQLADVDSSTSGAIGQWLWRITWNQKLNCGYGFSYDKDKNIYLMKTVDGVKYEKVTVITNEMLPNDALNESTIRFKDDGTAIAFIRTTRNALIAKASMESDYKEWSVEVVPFRVGGPNFIISNDGAKLWAATRHLFLTEDNALDETTVVGLLDEKHFTPLTELKSYGDSSYPAMVPEDDDTFTVAYYTSSIDGKSEIRITRLRP